MNYAPPADASIHDRALGISATPGPARTLRCKICGGHFELDAQIVEHLIITHAKRQIPELKPSTFAQALEAYYNFAQNEQYVERLDYGNEALYDRDKCAEILDKLEKL